MSDDSKAPGDTTITDEEFEAATIPIKDGRYFSQIWFISSANNTRDWLGALFRDGDGPWQGRYRFRYYRDHKAHGSRDRKSCYAIAIAASAPEDAALAVFNKVVDIIAAEFGGELHKLVLRTSSADKVIEALQRETWAHLAMG